MELKYYLRGLGLGIAITAIIMGIATSKNKTMTNEEIIARAKQLGMTQDTVLTEINSGKEDGGQDQTEPSDSKTDAADSDLPGSAGSDVSTSDLGTGTDNDNNDVQGNSEENAPAKNPSGDSLETGARVADSQSDTGTDGSQPDDGAAGSRPGARTTDSGTDAEAGESKPETPEENISIPSGPMVITIGHGDGSYSASKKLADVGAVSSASEFDEFLCQNGYDKKIRAGTYTIPADASEEQMARIITGVE